jgi:hypothetical protein
MDDQTVADLDIEEGDSIEVLLERELQQYRTGLPSLSIQEGLPSPHGERWMSIAVADAFAEVGGQ